ncbi:MAG: hypothetical protein JW982_16510 [Spirochaetes bacterium]|nr:hypothetical protein [Spirochaetota bacterium]
MQNYFKTGLIHFLMFAAASLFPVLCSVSAVYAGLNFSTVFAAAFGITFLTSPVIYGSLMKRQYGSFEGSGFRDFYMYGLKQYFSYYLVIIVVNLIISAPLFLAGMIVLFISASKAAVYIFLLFSFTVFIFASGAVIRKWLYSSVFED